jgi:hypothetical protein
VNEVIAIGLGLGAAFLLTRRADAAPAHGFTESRYVPFAEDTRSLFREAARLEGLPLWWADSDSLHSLLERESNGYVGLPNGALRHPEHWSQIWDRAVHGDRSFWVPPGSERSMETTSCTGGKVNPYGTSYIGLGQLGPGDCGQGWVTGEGSVRFLPRGAQSLGDPLDEARGMLAYIDSRYDDPDHAWALYFTKSPPWY